MDDDNKHANITENIADKYMTNYENIITLWAVRIRETKTGKIHIYWKCYKTSKIKC